MSIQLAGINCVRQLQRRADFAACWIGRVLIDFEFFNGDGEWRCLRFMDESLHRDVAREEILFEDDAEFLICRPIFGRLEHEDVALNPVPCAAQMRLKPHPLDGWLP